MVVFEVAGVIDLAGQRLEIREPAVTVAGQTAPSPGITLIRAGISIHTHDVVIRHLRVRPGEAEQPKQGGWETDGISTTTGAHDVIVDQCSISWATDENLTASGERFSGATPDAWRAATSHRITFSNNLVAEGLSNSTHRKGEHSKGTLIHDNVTDAAVVRNLYLSNVERNPFFKGGARGVVVNNWIQNPKKYAMKYTLVADEWGERPHQLGQMAIVGNVFGYGPDTQPEVPLLFASGVGSCEVFLADNRARDATGREVPLLGSKRELFLERPAAPVWPAGVTPLPVDQVRAFVAGNVGARPWERDSVDQRLLREALAGGGRIVDDERAAGGYPVTPAAQAAFDPQRWDLDCWVPRAMPR